MLFFITISCASAADNETIELAIEEGDISTPEVLTEEDEDTLDFTQLNSTISQATENEIKLENDYTYNSSKDTNLKDGIVVDKDNLVINGDNHIIDASKESKIFKITGNNVTLKNIKFINGRSNDRSDEGTVVQFEKTGRVENCTFINNSAAGHGIVNFENGTVTESTFISNFAEVGGGVYFNGNGNVSYSNFINNTAGIASAVSIEYGTIHDSNFTGNRAAKTGGAVLITTGNIRNCNFINNEAQYGGAVDLTYNVNIENSKFIGNNATKQGGAIFAESGTLRIENSIFENNNAADKSGNVCLLGYSTLISVNNTPKGLATLTFTDLAKKISECTGNVLVLSENYEYNPSRDGDYANGIQINNDNLTIDGDGITIDADNQARIFNITGNNVTLKNINFINGYTKEEGGAIVGDFNEEILTVENCNFTDNNAGYGGAISILGDGEVKITNTQFINNTASMSGGAIDVNEALIDNCEFTDNNAGNGGAVLIWNYTSIKNSRFTKNTAAKYGGAVYADDDHLTTMITIENSTFEDNSARYGGAILAGYDLNVVNSNFNNNTANDAGGALHGINVNVANSNFSNNSVVGAGGAISSVNLTVENSNFTKNNSTKSGGAIYTLGANIKNSNFDSNNITFDGGAIFINSYNSTIEGSSFTNNNAGRYGGAIYIDKNELKINNSTFKGNTAPDESYNVYIKQGATIITNNTTPEKLIIASFKSLANKINTSAGNLILLTEDYLYNPIGDASYVNGVEINKDNLIIDGQGHTIDGANQARILNVLAYNVTIRNINFINGNTSFGGASIFLGGGGAVIDCNFTNNHAWQGGAIDSNGQTNISNCNFISNDADISGAVNINGNGSIKNSKFINNTAVQRGGAVYLQTGTVNDCEFISNAAEGNGGALNIRRNATVKNSNFADNHAEYGGAIYMGNYTVNIVNNTFKNNTANGKSYNVYAANESKLVSENNTPRNIIPTGFKSLAELINDCEGNILVLDGDYWFNPDTDSELIDGVEIDKDNFTLDGQGHTINGLGQARILGVSGENVTIKNINFINGYAVDYNGGAIYFMKNATVENCSFKNNTAGNEGGAIFFQEFGSIIDSTFEDNYALRWGGAVYFEKGGIVDNSQFINNTADIYAGAFCFTDNGTVNDSNFTKNAANHGGAIYFRTNGTVSNSLFTDNHADTDGGAILINHNATISNAEFINNTADEKGGAVFAYNGNLDIENVYFKDNAASIYGGAIYADTGNVNLENIIFTDNIARKYTENILLGEEVTLTFNNITPNDFITRNFESLKAQIESCSGNILVLNCDYAHYTSSIYEDITQIPIERDNFTIDGQGHTIDAVGLAGIFHITGNNVTLKNINFINGLHEMDAGAIFSDVENGLLIIDNCNFTNNKGSYGAIKINQEGKLIVNNSNFNNNEGFYTGAISAYDIILTNSKFQANKASQEAGAVYAYYAIIRDSEFAQNNGRYGGAVYIKNNGTIENSIFTDNHAHKEGGAVYFANNGTVENSKFINNTADTGGAVYMGNNGEVSDSEFENNNASVGGAIHINKGIVRNSNFTSNYASSNGGAVNFNEGTVENCRFTDNTADNNGGAVKFSYEGNVTESTFSNNRAERGGAIHSSLYSNTNIKNSIFTNNTATHDGGGAIFLTDASNVDNCNFTDNHGGQYGGAIYVQYDNVTVENSIFTNNSATELGGAVYFAKSGNVEGSAFISNSVAGDATIVAGGAVFFADNGTVSNSEFTNNTASRYGGAAYFDKKGSIENSTFTGNHAEEGGALYLKDDGEIDNVNFTLNSADDGGAISTSGNLNITDSSFTDNAAVGGTDSVALKNNAQVTLSNVTPESLSPYHPVIMELVNVTNITSGDIVNITLHVEDLNGDAMSDGNVSVTINNQKYRADVSAGEAVISIPGLNAGTYNVDVTYYKNDDYAQPSVKVSFNVAKLASSLEIVEVMNNETYYGGIISIKANVTSNNMPVSDGFILISVNGGNYSAEVRDGIATIVLRNIDAGEYSENVTYIGINYENQIKSVAFKVMKASAEINVTVNDITYGETAIINVNVTSNTTYVNEGSVSIVINGKAYSASVTNQMATIVIPGLAAGTYTGNVSYDSANFNNPVENITFNVLKLNTGITASSNTYVINYGGKYSITLKDEKGNLLSGQKVIFTLNGNSIGSAITNDKGVATITLTAKMLKTSKAGNRNLDIKFDGTGNYNPTSKTVKITIKKEKTKIAAKKKTFKKSQKVKKYTIKLKNSKGKAVKKVKVYLKIKGKTYKAKTNSKGKATFKIKKLTKKGTYKSKITFKGNKYYSKATKKVKIKIK